MLQHLYDHLDIVLCALILISRIGDIGTTYLVTPNMLLEANPMMRRLGWKFALMTLLAAAMPFFSLQAGVVILVPFLMGNVMLAPPRIPPRDKSRSRRGWGGTSGF